MSKKFLSDVSKIWIGKSKKKKKTTLTTKNDPKNIFTQTHKDAYSIIN
jgi:hypothetical protein